MLYFTRMLKHQGREDAPFAITRSCLTTSIKIMIYQIGVISVDCAWSIVECSQKILLDVSGLHSVGTQAIQHILNMLAVKLQQP